MPTHRTTASVLRLRERPSTEHAIIGRLPQHTALDLLQGPTKGWARVRAKLRDGELIGWVSTSYIEPVATAPPIDDPSWLKAARAEIGTKEYPGPSQNPRILEYFQTCSYKATTDETPWCSAFVNWCMVQAKINGTKSAAARSWNKWGRELSAPEHGCIVVFDRGDPTNNKAAHVAFYLETRGTGILVLGGNQSNSVSITSYSASRVLGYRGKP
ncbi:MAG: TIGR02594 family protein [Flavobacteriales bacterium]|nr:TIGR02594 family protein [Flavobacteriales bacterium]